MKFAHLADSHLGGWRDPRMMSLNLKSFQKALSICKEKQVDFILFSGDIFNVSLPSLDILKEVFKEFKKLKEQNIPIYLIPGSHDFSPTGKTVLDLFELAGLAINVVKGNITDNGKLNLKLTKDSKTNVLITGMLGKKGSLERAYYEGLERSSLEEAKGYKIFMFHSAISELRPKGLEEMDGMPLSLLPKGFDYYAGGHVHTVLETNEEGYGDIVFPGPLFPNNFKEMEELGKGGFYLVEDRKKEHIPLDIFTLQKIIIDANSMTPLELEEEIRNQISKETLNENTIITLRIHGSIKGKVSDINFRELNREYQPAFLMKNLRALKSESMEEVKLVGNTVEEIEETLLKEHIPEKINHAKDIMITLSKEKQEGERVIDFENRIITEMDTLFKHFSKEDH